MSYRLNQRVLMALWQKHSRQLLHPLSNLQPWLIWLLIAAFLAVIPLQAAEDVANGTVVTKQAVVLWKDTQGSLSCDVKRSSYAVYWNQGDETEVLVFIDMYYNVGEKSGQGYASGLFDISVNDTDFKLIIRNVTVEHEGRYFCHATDFNTGQDISNFTDVTVNVHAALPFIRIKQCKERDGELNHCIYRLSGSDMLFKLQCSVYKSKPKVYLTWSGESDIINDTVTTFRQRSDGTFDVHAIMTGNVSALEEGTQFTCTGNGSAVNGTANRIVFVYPETSGPNTQYLFSVGLIIIVVAMILVVNVRKLQRDPTGLDRFFWVTELILALAFVVTLMTILATLNNKGIEIRALYVTFIFPVVAVIAFVAFLINEARPSKKNAKPDPKTQWPNKANLWYWQLAIIVFACITILVLFMNIGKWILKEKVKGLNYFILLTILLLSLNVLSVIVYCLRKRFGDRSGRFAGEDGYFWTIVAIYILNSIITLMLAVLLENQHPSEGLDWIYMFSIALMTFNFIYLFILVLIRRNIRAHKPADENVLEVNGDEAGSVSLDPINRSTTDEQHEEERSLTGDFSSVNSC